MPAGGARPNSGGKRAGAGRKTGFTALSSSYARQVIESIEVKKLITRLTAHATGESEMEPSQVQAAKILLDKVLSNAPTRTEVSGPDGGDVPVGIRVSFTDAA